MGTRVVVLLPVVHAERAAEVRDLFARWEAVLSRFRPTSPLSRLNARAGRTCPVDPLLAEVLAAALAAARTTDGAFDPGLGAHLEHLGYDRSFDRMAAELPPAAAPVPARGAWRDIVLDRAAGTARLPAGMRLDLGGIAKGMAVDAAAGALRRAGVPAGLVSAGGDLAVWGLPPGREAWTIVVPGPAGAAGVAPLRRGALATSGVARRRWRQGGEERHHLIDPRTGLPAAGGLHSVSVVAPSCREAEVLAKAAFVLGPGAGRALLERRGLPALLVPRSAPPRAVGAWA